MASSRRARDATQHLSNMTRNKENFPHAPSLLPSPSPSPAPHRGSGLRPSLVKSPDKQPEFWTDSFLGNNASPSSLIPSPLPSSNAPLSKPRRIVRPQRPPPDLHRLSRHSQTRPELTATSPDDLRRSHQEPLARTTSPVRSTGLSTPPSSREGSFAGSPRQILSSPPQALTDTYSRIDQEEDLAATEGQISDPDSDSGGRAKVRATYVNGYASSKHSSADDLPPMSHSRAATPTNHKPSLAGRFDRHENPTTASVFSDPTGMSFVDQLSDPGLRSTLTPHMLQSAADREALYKTWKSKKPVAFGKAGKVLLDADDLADSVSSSPHPQPERVIAFTKAAKFKLASDHPLRPQHQRTFSDVTEQMDRPVRDHTRPAHNDNWHNDDIRHDAMPHNPRVQREPYFPRNHGFPQRNTGPDQDKAGFNGITGGFRKARSESPLTSIPRPVTAAVRLERDSSDQAQFVGRFKPVPENYDDHSDTGSIGDNQPPTQTLSDIWAQSAADRPLQSIERGTQPRSQSLQSDTRDLQVSPEKSRRFDMDFTGQSFQVSDSPPVRGKSLAQDYSRDREIRGLAQQAVTTSRLTQLRARESQEKLRQHSRSPVSDTGDRHTLEKSATNARESDTPAAIYRTSSNGSGANRAPTVIANPTPDRSQSHDILQRLARGSSSTPRSLTPSDHTINGSVINGGHHPDTRVRSSDGKTSNDGTTKGSNQTGKSDLPVQATPKVVGAWTDTILPDTVKTTKRNPRNSSYAQTPHVSAGAWIETPAPNGQTAKLEPVQEVTQEIPEELMNGIVKDSASDRTLLAKDQPPGSIPAGPTQASESLAKKVLSEAKDKLESRDKSHPAADDSFMLGNVTIQSLENLLDMDETILSRLGIDEPLGQSDTEVLDRLGTKLGRLQNHLHDARKGISMLEHQMSQPPETETTQLLTTTTEPAKSTSTSFPLNILTLSIPIPILYRPRKKGQYLPRPTPLGWVLLTLWLWYLLECTLVEIYSHPQYAEQYTWPIQREPEFPFVLPTMIWRWSHLQCLQSSVLQPLQGFFMGVVRMVGMWFGVTDGFTEGPGTAVVTPQVPVQMQPHDTAVVFDMMNDEYV